MNNLSFSQDLATSLYCSKENYPVDLDDAWQWLGYNQKSDCLSKLKANFEEGGDFSAKSLKSPTGGRPRVSIMLTIDCFKSMGMMAGTSQGKAIRKYFLECEKVAKNTPAPRQNNLNAYIERVRQMHSATHNIPDGYWCILHESAELLIWIESVMGYPVDKDDIVDISIGQAWAKERSNQPWAKQRVKCQYKYPDGRLVSPWVYSFDELPQFKVFLGKIYKPKILPRYLESKYGKLAKTK